MTVTITSRDEWDRILDNVQPQWLAVSSDREWFRNGFGMIFVLEAAE